MRTDVRAVSWAWVTLLVVSCASIGTAEYFRNRTLAITVIMSITAVKGGIIASRFMSVASAPTGVRLYISVWILLMALMIAILFWLGQS
jgi:hypothetical protein